MVHGAIGNGNCSCGCRHGGQGVGTGGRSKADPAREKAIKEARRREKARQERLDGYTTT